MKKISFSFLLLFLNLMLFSQDYDLFRMINEYRNENGIGSLVIEEELIETASAYCQVLGIEKRISHIDRNGHRVLDRYRAQGGTAAEAGEILGTSTDSQKIFMAWKESESHKRMILNPKWMRIGVAETRIGNSIIAVVLFSTSIIAEIKYSGVEDDLLVNIQMIPSEDPAETDSIFLQFQTQDLPILYPVYQVSDGKKKITDFLYIPDNLLTETH